MSCLSELQAVLVFIGVPFVVTDTDYVKREKLMIARGQNNLQPTDPAEPSAS